MSNSRKIGINNFALRQTESDFVGTRLKEYHLKDIQFYCEISYGLGANNFEDSDYADFCKYVRITNLPIKIHQPFINEVKSRLIEEIQSPTAEITEENKHLLVTQYRTRREGELPYLTRKFPKGSIETGHTDHLLVILYSREQLEKEYSEKHKDPPMGTDYDIICVNAEASEMDAPMTPDTLIRNHMGKVFGGSGVEIDMDKYMESVEYWSKYAMVEF